MKLVLLKDVKNIGKEKEIVEVAAGYATNYLIPNKLAIVYTKTSNEVLKQQIKQEEKIYNLLVGEAVKLKEALEHIQLVFHVKVNNGKSFGTISNKSIIHELSEKYDITINKFMIETHDNLILGTNQVFIRLHKEVLACLTVQLLEQIGND